MATNTPGIQISLFKDLYEAIRMVAADVRGLAGIPAAKRAEILKSISEAYAILNIATSLVAARLGKVLERAALGNAQAFAEELAALQSFQGWYDIEREASLCSAMRSTQAALNKSLGGLVSRKAVRDWPTVQAQMVKVLGNESDLARHITTTLESLSKLAPVVLESPAEFERARGLVQAARDDLLAERQQMIRDEAALYDVI